MIPGMAGRKPVIDPRNILWKKEERVCVPSAEGN
jgi:hypothetical protein